jgi:hypothetical protein
MERRAEAAKEELNGGWQPAGQDIITSTTTTITTVGSGLSSKHYSNGSAKLLVCEEEEGKGSEDKNK